MKDTFLMGKTVLITGASTLPGIGSSIANSCIIHGSTHVILVSKDSKRITSTASAFRRDHPRVRITTICQDLSEIGAAKKSV